MPVWHVDLYRIEDPAELEELALDEALAGRRADRRMAGADWGAPCGRIRFGSPCAGKGRAPAP